MIKKILYLNLVLQLNMFTLVVNIVRIDEFFSRLKFKLKGINAKQAQNTTDQEAVI